jgi:lipopolysaccharide biosynthesis regulator YciM
MNKYLISLTIAGMAAVFLLYQLPRTAVKNEDESSVESHSFNMSNEDAAAITSLKTFTKGEISENYINFADSLARYYIKYGFLDSAKNVTMKFLQRDSSLQTQKKAATLLYASYERASNMKEAAVYALEARKVLTLITQKEVDNISAKTKLAMTLVITENPMSGIMLLREVLEKDPKNREALLNLGLLSIQSGQYERGVERFEKLIALKEDDYEAMLYMGVCLLEINKSEESSELFTRIVAAEDADPALKSAAAEYLDN